MSYMLANDIIMYTLLSVDITPYNQGKTRKGSERPWKARRGPEKTTWVKLHDRGINYNELTQHIQPALFHHTWIHVQSTLISTLTSSHMYRLPWPARVITPSPSTFWSSAKHISLLEVHCKNFKPYGFSAAKPLIIVFLVCREDMLRRNSSFCILPTLFNLLRQDDLGTIAGISGSSTRQLSRSLPCYGRFLLLRWGYTLSNGIKGS